MYCFCFVYVNEVMKRDEMMISVLVYVIMFKNGVNTMRKIFWLCVKNVQSKYSESITFEKQQK